MEPLIVQNTRIPVRVTQTFTNGKDGQTTLRIHILQGNTERAEEACSLGYFDLEGIPPLPQNQARIAITFSLDVDGLLTVSAQEETTGVEQSVSLKPAYRLKNALRDTSFSSCG
jgi:molecular chaperone HscA